MGDLAKRGHPGWRDDVVWGGAVSEREPSAAAVAAAALRRVAALPLDADPLHPAAILRARRTTGEPASAAPLLRAWERLAVRETGVLRYRWHLDGRFAGTTPAWVGPESTWVPWRPADAHALAAVPDRSAQFCADLLTPIILADAIQLLRDASGGTGARRSRRDGPSPADPADRLLEEAMPKLRRDAAAWVQERHSWADTWALRALARRPAALSALHPFALAIGDGYAVSARRADGKVLGKRFPFHDVALVSASAHLATGLIALGIHPRLVGELARWIRTMQRPDEGWGDGDGPSDLLTTFVAADLLGAIDPTFDPWSAARWLLAAERHGWWRGYGPETTWLTVEVAEWLTTVSAPLSSFGERFRWPQIAVTAYDRRTHLPWYSYYADLARLFQEVPGLATAPVEVAFLDLAGFGEVNNAHGMAVGDQVLRAFAEALANLPRAMAIRDGGDEFLVVGAPTATGLAGRLTAFRKAWPALLQKGFGDRVVVAPRVLTCVVPGSAIIRARDHLGIEIGSMKHDHEVVGSEGVQVDLGWVELSP
jgi:Diguanylate cyclase, GGDEF domain